VFWRLNKYIISNPFDATTYFFQFSNLLDLKIVLYKTSKEAAKNNLSQNRIECQPGILWKAKTPYGASVYSDMDSAPIHDYNSLFDHAFRWTAG
jgi:hypothetical protein